MATRDSLFAIFTLILFGFSVNNIATGQSFEADAYEGHVKGLLSSTNFIASIRNELSTADFFDTEFDSYITQALEEITLKEVNTEFDKLAVDIENIKREVLNESLPSSEKDFIIQLKEMKTNDTKNMANEVYGHFSNITRDEEKKLEDKYNEVVSELNKTFDVIESKVNADIARLRSIEKTTEKQPIAFGALLTSNAQNDTHVIVFDHVVSNSGNGYDDSNGVFTAPVKGVYIFMVSFLVDDGYININLQKNGQEVVRGYAAKHNFEGTGFLQTIVNLNKRDQVEISMIQDNCTGHIRGDFYSSFSGLMIDNY